MQLDETVTAAPFRGSQVHMAPGLGDDPVTYLSSPSAGKCSCQRTCHLVKNVTMHFIYFARTYRLVRQKTGPFLVLSPAGCLLGIYS